MIDVVALHDPDVTEMSEHLLAADLATGGERFLLPDTDITAILRAFNHTDSEILPVLTSPVSDG